MADWRGRAPLAIGWYQSSGVRSEWFQVFGTKFFAESDLSQVGLSQSRCFPAWRQRTGSAVLDVSEGGNRPTKTFENYVSRPYQDGKDIRVCQVSNKNKIVQYLLLQLQVSLNKLANIGAGLRWSTLLFRVFHTGTKDHIIMYPLSFDDLSDILALTSFSKGVRDCYFAKIAKCEWMSIWILTKQNCKIQLWMGLCIVNTLRVPSIN